MRATRLIVVALAVTWAAHALAAPSAAWAARVTTPTAGWQWVDPQSGVSNNMQEFNWESPKSNPTFDKTFGFPSTWKPHMRAIPDTGGRPYGDGYSNHFGYVLPTPGSADGTFTAVLRWTGTLSTHGQDAQSETYGVHFSGTAGGAIQRVGQGGLLANEGVEIGGVYPAAAALWYYYPVTSEQYCNTASHFPYLNGAGPGDEQNFGAAIATYRVGENLWHTKAAVWSHKTGFTPFTTNLISSIEETVSGARPSYTVSPRGYGGSTQWRKDGSSWNPALPAQELGSVVSGSAQCFVSTRSENALWVAYLIENEYPFSAGGQVLWSGPGMDSDLPTDTGMPVIPPPSAPASASVDAVRDWLMGQLGFLRELVWPVAFLERVFGG